MIDHLDHIVITTDHEAGCIRFYCEVLGMRYETFIGGNPPVERKSFKFRSTCTSRATSSSPRRTCRCPARSTCASSPAFRWTK